MSIRGVRAGMRARFCRVGIASMRWMWRRSLRSMGLQGWRAGAGAILWLSRILLSGGAVGVRIRRILGRWIWIWRPWRRLANSMRRFCIISSSKNLKLCAWAKRRVWKSMAAPWPRGTNRLFWTGTCCWASEERPSISRCRKSKTGFLTMEKWT